MSTYRKEWDCCGSVTETQAWEPESCPFCAAPPAVAVVPSAPRFKVVSGSQSMHCCFDATVVDTTNPVTIRGEHYNNQYEALCETFDRADADLICAALNAQELAEAGKGE